MAIGNTDSGMAKAQSDYQMGRGTLGNSREILEVALVLAFRRENGGIQGSGSADRFRG